MKYMQICILLTKTRLEFHVLLNVKVFCFRRQKSILSLKEALVHLVVFSKHISENLEFIYPHDS